MTKFCALKLIKKSMYSQELVIELFKKLRIFFNDSDLNLTITYKVL